MQIVIDHWRRASAWLAAAAGFLLLVACAGVPPAPGSSGAGIAAAAASGTPAAQAAAPAATPASASAASPVLSPAAPVGGGVAPAVVNGGAAGALAGASSGTPNGTPTGIARAAADTAARPLEAATLESAARAFITYFERVRQMSPGELGREFVRLDAPAHPANVLELALALGQTRNPGDTARAIGVLDPLARSSDPNMAPWRPLARLLSARYAEQRRLEEQVERQAQQLRDAQRRQEQLTQQLEALKAIERSLTNRPSATPQPTSPAGSTNRTPP